jgi:antitoxin component of RelBE/YafQ-DinJ toxin-antitoxin module
MSMADKFDSVISVRVSSCMLEKFQAICQAIEVHPSWLLRKFMSQVIEAGDPIERQIPLVTKDSVDTVC